MSIKKILSEKKTKLDQTKESHDNWYSYHDNSDQLFYVDIDTLIPNPDQPRRHFSKESLEELAESIKERGLIQPLSGKEQEGKIFLIAGERRLRAARMAGMKRVPVFIRRESQIDEDSLIENVQREDLNCIEEAIACQKLMDRHGYNQSELARKLSRSRKSIQDTLLLLTLPESIKSRVLSGKDNTPKSILIEIASFDGSSQKKESLYSQVIKLKLNLKNVRDIKKGQKSKSVAQKLIRTIDLLLKQSGRIKAKDIAEDEQSELFEKIQILRNHLDFRLSQGFH